MSMTQKIPITRQYWVLIFPLTGYIIGHYLVKHDNECRTRFRDKSALFGRTLAPGEPPSW